MKTKTFSIPVLFIFMSVLIFAACDNTEDNEEPTDPNKGTVKDVEGNTYPTIKIDDQWWMAENLTTTKFRGGDDIPNVTGQGEWANLQDAAYCNSGNDPVIAEDYGRLYNWHAVTDGRKICPEGWHVSNDDDWSTLIDFLGGNQVAGGKLKQTGNEYWNNPNSDATNESGFSALPGGVRNANTGDFAGMGSTGSWWSASAQNADNGYAWGLTTINGAIAHYNLNKKSGLSVRCVKD